MASSIYSFEIINVVTSATNIFFWIAASVADTVNLKGVKTLLSNSVSTFFIKHKLVFSNGPRGLPKGPPDSPTLDSIFIL